MHAQDDFKTGHLIFLERYYRAASEFGVYSNRFTGYMVRGITTGIIFVSIALLKKPTMI
jgi:hypothetical protein